MASKVREVTQSKAKRITLKEKMKVISKYTDTTL